MTQFQPQEPKTGTIPEMPAVQPHTGYHQWVQPQQWSPPSTQVYQQPPSYQSTPPVQQPPKKKSRATLWFVSAIVVVVVLAIVIGVASQSKGGNTSPNAGLPPQQYKAATTDITVANLDKDGNSDSGKDVHVIATIANFVKDSNGNTAGANVYDPTTIGSVIQVIFPSGTDLSQLNIQDVIEAWGSDEGTSTGTNAFGATVHEVVVSVLYLTDRTTGYSE